LINVSDAPAQIEIRLPGDGPWERWDPETGDVQAIAGQMAEVSLPPYEGLFFVAGATGV